MKDVIETVVPGRPAIPLVSFYDELRDFYPLTELETKRWFVENIRPDWWIFDLGANIGYYSILFGQLAPQGKVLAFEPTRTADMLKTNLAHNDVRNVEVHQVAIGATTGVHKERVFRVWGNEAEVQDYPFYRLDDFVAEYNPTRIDCLKIDVDSFDFDVLRGAGNTLRKWNPYVVVELNDALAKRNQSEGEALEWLAAQGYRKALILDHRNFVLRHEETDRASDGELSMKLVFPPPRPSDESIDVLDGQVLAHNVFSRICLCNDAQLRAASADPKRQSWFGARKRTPQLPSRRDPVGELQAILDHEIETTSVRWDYALQIDISDPSHGRQADGLLSVEISLEVLAGKVGIFLVGDDQSSLFSLQRIVLAMPGRQRIVVSAPLGKARHVILSNVALEGEKSVFKVKGVRGKSKSA